MRNERHRKTDYTVSTGLRASERRAKCATGGRDMARLTQGAKRIFKRRRKRRDRAQNRETIREDFNVLFNERELEAQAREYDRMFEVEEDENFAWWSSHYDEDYYDDGDYDDYDYPDYDLEGRNERERATREVIHLLESMEERSAKGEVLSPYALATVLEHVRRLARED